MAKRRPRPDRSNRNTGFPEFEHNQWTFEGCLERLAAFGRGAVRRHGSARWIAALLVLLIAGPAVVGAFTAFF